jgi:hypothetical protein
MRARAKSLEGAAEVLSHALGANASR